MSQLSHFIDNDQNDFFALSFWETFDEIHGDVLPSHVRWVQWIYQTRLLAMFCFCSLADSTFRDVVCDVFFHSWPVEQSFLMLITGDNTRVTSNG
jgi:hypothetical protein